MSTFSLRLFYFILVITMLFFKGSEVKKTFFSRFDVKINTGNYRVISDVTSEPNLNSSISPDHALKATNTWKYNIIQKTSSKILKNLRHAVYKMKRFLFGSTKSSFENI